MKRLHVHITVDDLEKSIAFYSALFDCDPRVTKDDYAKWQLSEPAVNFAISTRCGTKGVDHLGIQVDSEEELAQISDHLKNAGQSVLEQEKAQCCYAVSDKTWVNDPQGVAWETFRTSGEITVYGGDSFAIEELPRLTGQA